MYSFLKRWLLQKLGREGTSSGDPFEKWPEPFQKYSERDTPPIPDDLNHLLEKRMREFGESHRQSTDNRIKAGKDMHARPASRRLAWSFSGAFLLFVIVPVLVYTFRSRDSMTGSGHKTETFRIDVIAAPESYITSSGNRKPLTRESQIRAGDLLRTSASGSVLLDVEGAMVRLLPLTLVKIEYETETERVVLNIRTGSLYYASTGRLTRHPGFTNDSWEFLPTGTAARISVKEDEIRIDVSEGAFLLGSTDRGSNIKKIRVEQGNGIRLHTEGGESKGNAGSVQALTSSTLARLEGEIRRLRLSPADYGEMGDPPYDRVLLRDGSVYEGRLLYEGDVYRIITVDGIRVLSSDQIKEIELP